MSSTSLVDRILAYNSGRDIERLALKYAAMRSSAYAFLRGTCHLFYADLPADVLLTDAPVVWCCGDLQLENFGTYKGDNRLGYVDINDFDDAALAPCTWDLARFLASVLVGTQTLNINLDEGVTLCRSYLDAYSRQLADGKARWVERATARGMIKDLLREVKRRDRDVFLDKRTDRHKRHRVLRTDGKKALPATEEEHAALRAFMQAFAESQPDPSFFRVLDVARRVAGLSSLGLERYVILVEGHGSPGENYLLDLKCAAPSSLVPALMRSGPGQPSWTDDATRIVMVQKRMQAISPAFLHAVTLDGKAYVLKELQPSEDRVNLGLWNGQFRRLETAITTMGEILAWAQLRSSGRQGSAIADTLIEFGKDDRWHAGMIDLATSLAQRTYTQWEEYAGAYDAGAFSLS